MYIQIIRAEKHTAALHRKNSFNFGQFLFAGLIEKMLVTIAGHFDLIRRLNLNQI